MNKERFLRLYSKLSVLIGIYVFTTMYFYVRTFPISFNGYITKTLMKITMTMQVGEFEISNIPLITFIVILVMNLIVIVNIRSTKNIDKQELREVMYINTILSVMIILGQILFFMFVPDQINGEIIDKFFYVAMPRLNDDIIKVFNINYALAIIYICYNVYVSLRTMPPKVINEDDFDEELYEKAFFDNLEDIPKVEEVENDK